MKINLKIGALAVIMLLGSFINAQSDSLGMPGDNLDLNAVLSIFKQSSSIEDFEKRLNSADAKINNLDLNSDNQVDYLRVVDYGKDDFHSIVIQDPVSKSESQDVAVIEIVKKENNTAHIQIVGDETLYGKDYILEPADQAPLKTEGADKNSANSNDDVYTSQNSSSANTHVMINVWAWPSVNYIYSPGYSYWVSPWYWGYYPGWYSPWRPYGGYAYRRNFYGYNYGFYGYRRYHPAFIHVHNYYYGRRVSSGYVQKTAPNYGRRREGPGTGGSRSNQQRNTGTANPRVRNSDRVQNKNTNSGRQSGVKTNENRATNSRTNRTQNGQQRERSNNKNTNQRSGGERLNNTGGQKGNNAPRSNGGSRSGGNGGGGHR